MKYYGMMCICIGSGENSYYKPNVIYKQITDPEPERMFTNFAEAYVEDGKLYEITRNPIEFNLFGNASDYIYVE